MKNITNINQQYQSIVAMISEIEKKKEDLNRINDSLFKAANHSCSEYGDRILENFQSKLFYFQRVLNKSIETLSKFESKLKDIKNGKLEDENTNDYFDYCQKSADKIRAKLDKYCNEVSSITGNIC